MQTSVQVAKSISQSKDLKLVTALDRKLYIDYLLAEWQSPDLFPSKYSEGHDLEDEGIKRKLPKYNNKQR